MVFREVSIQEFRTIVGLKQETLCEALGLSQAMYSKIETGKCKTTLRNYQILSKILGVDVESVLENRIRIYVFVDTKDLNLSAFELEKDEAVRAMIDIIEKARIAIALNQKRQP